MIEISGTLTFQEGSASTLTEDIATRFMRQIAHDAVYGSFADFPNYWNGKWERLLNKLVEDPPDVKQQGDRGIFEFTLRLSTDLFPLQPAGLQHLIGILAGDLFYLSVLGFEGVQIVVDEVDLPTPMSETAFSLFRHHRAYGIEAIQRLFRLSDEPLLAFSFKPRVGIRFSEIEAVTLGVLESGFHLVELDTRNIALDERRVEQLLSLATKAAEVGAGHVTRFSPNLTVPAPLVTELTKRFLDVQPDPAVIKIDGGLDGISSCQSVRRTYQTDPGGAAGGPAKAPIITCYPLLRSQLVKRIPSIFYVNALAMSGVDIIYPGGRPSLGSGGRTLGAEARGRLISSVRHYRNYVRNGWPMPTVAGGVYAGELHSFYELLGPKVAFFIGGGVALHKDGPIAGARLCVEVIKEAARLRRRIEPHADAPNLDGNIITRIEKAYGERGPSSDVNFHYIPPTSVINTTVGLDSWFATT